MKRSDPGDADTVTVVGSFPGFAEARRAVEALQTAGCRAEQIGAFGPGTSAELQQHMIGEDARWSAAELEVGRAVVAVRTTNAAAVRDILDKYGATLRPPAETAIPGNALLATPY